MNKPRLINHNSYPESLLAWCRTQDKESITRAILESTGTQFQFRADDPADDSGKWTEDKTTEGFC